MAAQDSLGIRDHCNERVEVKSEIGSLGKVRTGGTAGHLLLYPIPQFSFLGRAMMKTDIRGRDHAGMDVVRGSGAGLGGAEPLGSAQAWHTYVKQRHVLRRGSTEEKSRVASPEPRVTTIG